MLSEPFRKLFPRNFKQFVKHRSLIKSVVRSMKVTLKSPSLNYDLLNIIDISLIYLGNVTIIKLMKSFKQ